MSKTSIVLLHQDLRLLDHQPLTAACEQSDKQILLYCYDEAAEHPVGEAQKWWLHHSLTALSQDLASHGAALTIRRGARLEVIQSLCANLDITSVHWHRRYEPAHIAEDKALKSWLKENNVAAQSHSGYLLFEPWTQLNKQGGYYKVYTPFYKNCASQFASIVPPIAKPNKIHSAEIEGVTIEELNLLPSEPDWSAGFSQYWQPGEQSALKQADEWLDDNVRYYAAERDFPALTQTSRLSPHLHFGEISIKTLLIKAINSHTPETMEPFLKQLIWREFSYYLLYHFPLLPSKNYAPKFEQFPWHTESSDLVLWQKGKTGYPIVDAGMLELWHTGTMHNRVRMIVASFLTKHLGIDWRLGAEWFWHTLLDADLANNSASWQWVAGCGADAAPYFRIFNPTLQGQKFDAEGIYVKKWLPQLKHLPKKYIHQPWLASAEILRAAEVSLGQNYPKPIVDHKQAREAAMATYQSL